MGMRLLAIIALILLQEPGRGLYSKVGEAVECEHETQIEVVTSITGEVFHLRRQFFVCDGQRYRLERYLLETNAVGSKKITLLVKKWDAASSRVTMQLFVAPKIEVVPVEKK